MRSLRHLSLLLALLLLPPSLGAQTVRGALLEEGSGAPVPGTMVVLLDQAGVQRAATLTDARGAFSLAAPAPGRYTVRAERVGYASTAAPVLELAAGEAREVRLTVAGRPVVLEGISVRGSRRRCSVRPESAAETAALWEEARKVLSATAWAEEASLFRHEVVRYERDLDARSLRVEGEQREERSTRVLRPFQSVPAGTLSERGFVQTTRRGTFYYAPDARVLLSDEFLDDHCYSLSEGEKGLVGLAFEPVPGRRVPEIRGVLWLDRATAELRYLEYGYVNLPISVPGDRLGGRVDFRRLPTGAWIVERWRVRMPRLQRVERLGAASGGMPAERRYEERLAGIREVGGEITATLTRDGVRVTEVDRMAVEGTVLDAAGSAPLEGATVFLSGTHLTATTDAGGKFRIEGVPEGEYLVSFSHPALEDASAPPLPRSAAVRRGETARVELRAPAVRLAARGRDSLPAGRAEETPGVLDRDPVELPGVTVAAPAYRSARLREFEHRRATGQGHYLTRADIERQRPSHTSDLFRAVPGVEVIWTEYGAYKLRMRASAPRVDPRLTPGSAAGGSAPMAQPDCSILYFVDGMMHPIPRDPREPILIDRIISPAEIEAIEVYRSGSQVPPEFRRPGARCGVVLIWTREPSRGR